MALRAHLNRHDVNETSPPKGISLPVVVTIVVAVSSLHFYRDTNFWFETTFTLPAGTDPQHIALRSYTYRFDTNGTVISISSDWKWNGDF